MVRSGADFGYNHWIRLTIGTREDNKKVIEALKEIVQARSKQTLEPSQAHQPQTGAHHG